jgi:hypothetical protein
MSQRSLLSLVGTISVALFASGALAQSADKSAAVALFDEAENLASAGSYREACPKYAESNRLDPQLGALMHLADCYEKAGQLASAWASFRDASEIAEHRGDPRAETASQRATALEPRLSRLAVIVPPEAAAPGLQVKRDGEALSSAIWGSAMPVDIGDHLVEASAPGKVAWKGIAKVAAEGSNDAITIPVLADLPVAAAPAAPAAGAHDVAAPAEADPGATRRILGWTVAGAGVVGLGVGVVFLLQRSSKMDEQASICPTGKGCTPAEGRAIVDATSQARSATTIGTIGLVAGGLLAAGGVTLVFTAPHSERQVAIVPEVGPSFQGVLVRSSLW